MKKSLRLVTYSALVLGALSMTTAQEASAAEWTARTPEQIQITDRSNYQIIWGDTLWAISEASGVSVDALVQINNIANRNLIYAGNSLAIDGDTVTVTEQNGEKSSFVVEGDTVTPTEDHAEVETPAVVDSEEGGNFSVVGGNSDVEQEANTEAPKGNTSNEESPKVDASKDEAPKAEESKDEAPKAEAPKEEAPKTETPKVEDKVDEDDGGGNFVVAPDEEEQVAPETPQQPEKPEEPAAPQLPGIDTTTSVQDMGDLGWGLNVDLSAGYTKANPLSFPQYAFPGSEHVSLYVEGSNIVFTHANQGSKTFPLSGGQTSYTDAWEDTVDVINIYVRSFGKVVSETPEVPEETPVVDEAAAQEARANEAIVGLRSAVGGPYEVNYLADEGYGNVFVDGVLSDEVITDGYDTYEEMSSARQSIIDYMASKGHELVLSDYGHDGQSMFTLSFLVK